MSLRKKLRLDECSENLDLECDQNAESKYFINRPLEIVRGPILNDIPDKLLQIELELVSKLDTLNFAKPVDYVYSPIQYAFETHSNFVKKFCTSTKNVLFLGLNPGPWGMSQTGVPFGEVNIVRDWLKISGNVQKPARELSVRPIEGLNCPRSEISGKRFWGLFQKVCGTPENFFKNAFIHNYCPIALMKDSGSNITPADLKGPIAKKLLDFCDDSLIQIINLLQVEKVVTIGRFVEKQVLKIFKTNGIQNIEVLFLLHPSPRVIGNENWVEKAEKILGDLDLLKYFQ